MEDKKISTKDMSKIKIVIVGSILVVLGIFVFVIFTPLSSKKENNNGIFLGEKKVSVWEAKTETRGAVDVSVQPENLSDDKNTEWAFAVSFNTHSEEMDDDVASISMLRDSNGKEYAPHEWKGDPPGGHHRSGILLFSPIIPRPDSISIVIKRPREESERRFTWDIKGR